MDVQGDEQVDAQKEAQDENGDGDQEEVTTGGVTRVGYAAISRVDAARREVELCATSEAVDSYGTIFDYAASKDAFTRWIGNVREMHERRAVGSRVGVQCDDEERKIYVRVRVSRGAQDTWEKICDGTLRGASIGAANVQWERQARAVPGGQRVVRVATHYDLAELSLVDNPSNPDALGLCIVRDAVPDTTLLDTLDALDAESFMSTQVDIVEPQAPSGAVSTASASTRVAEPPSAKVPTASTTTSPTPDEARTTGPFSTADAGAPDTGVPEPANARPTSFLGQGPIGNTRERLHTAARGILAGCGCVRCVGALAALGGDDDASEDTPTTLADRLDGASLATEEREAHRLVARVAVAHLAASAALVERMEASLSHLGERFGEHAGQVGAIIAELRAVGERVATLEAQPLPGGPVARAVGYPVEKTHALTPTSGNPAEAQPGESLRALEALAGRLRDPQAQMAVAAELIRLQRGEG